MSFVFLFVFHKRRQKLSMVILTNFALIQYEIFNSRTMQTVVQFFLQLHGIKFESAATGHRSLMFIKQGPRREETLLTHQLCCCSIALEKLHIGKYVKRGNSHFKAWKLYHSLRPIIHLFSVTFSVNLYLCIILLRDTTSYFPIHQVY